LHENNPLPRVTLIAPIHEIARIAEIAKKSKLKTEYYGLVTDSALISAIFGNFGLRGNPAIRGSIRSEVLVRVQAGIF